jgi:hypothetical protein
MSDIGDKLRVFFMRYIGFAGVAIVCVVYVWSAFVDLEETGKSVRAIILDGSAAFVGGICMQNLFLTLARIHGHREQRVMEAEEAHANAVTDVMESGGMEELNNWCQEENIKNKKNQRIRILADAGLSYDQCFNEDGTPKNFSPRFAPWGEILTRGIRMWLLTRRIASKQAAAFRKAVFIRLTELSAGVLTGGGRKSNDPFYMGRDEGEYQKQKTISGAVSKLGTGIVFGYYCMDVLVNFSLPVLLGRLGETLWLLVLGILTFIGAMMYMTGEFRERLLAMASHLKRFMSEKKKGDAQHDKPQKDGTGSVSGGSEGRGAEQEKDLAERGEGSLDGGSAGAARADLPGADLRRGGEA